MFGNRFFSWSVLVLLSSSVLACGGSMSQKTSDYASHGAHGELVTLRHANTKESLIDLPMGAYRENGARVVPMASRRQLRTLLRDWRTGEEHPMSHRLLGLLADIAQHFGQPLDVVSGFRSKARKTSRHRHGNAVDFRVRGVPAKTVWQYAKRFKRVGVGWYPVSGFVHLDVRSRSYYWIDDSGPGEAPKYRRGVSQAPNPLKADTKRMARISGKPAVRR